MRHLGKLGYLATAMMLLVGLAQPARADMPMFYVVALTKAMYWWTLPLVVVIEAAAIHWIFQFPWKRAAIASALVNLVTLLVGAIAYPFIGILFYIGVASLVVRFTGSGLLVEPVATLTVMALIDTAIELACLAWIFKAKVKSGNASLFLLANIISAGALFAVLAIG